MGHSEVDVYFEVYSTFAESKYWLHKCLFSGRYSKWEPFFIKLPRYFKSGGEQHYFFLRLNKKLYGQDEAARLCYENFRNGLLERIFLMSKVYSCLFMSKTLICVVYVDDCFFWEFSQSDIGNVMKSFKEDGPSYNWEYSKG